MTTFDFGSCVVPSNFFLCKLLLVLKIVLFSKTAILRNLQNSEKSYAKVFRPVVAARISQLSVLQFTLDIDLRLLALVENCPPVFKRSQGAWGERIPEAYAVA